MNRLKSIGLVLAIGLLFSACFKDEEPGTPAYIVVESIQLQVDTGTLSTNITDAWIGVDGQAIGAGTFPARFPVIINESFDTNSIRIQAGIKKNGVTNTRAIYPFYKPFVLRKALQPGEEVVINPVVGYDPAAKLIIVEDFENINQPVFSEDIDDNANTGVRFQTDDVFEGTYSGEVYLDSANLECTVGTSNRYGNLVNISATPVYLEMNFKTNTVVQVGIRAHFANGSIKTIYKGGLNVVDSWRKIYFDYTQEVFGANATSYSVVLRAVKSDVEPKIYIDNVQLLHF